MGSFSTLGALFGGQIGGNYQIGQFVIGAEGDFDWQNLRGASASGICAPAVIGGCAVASNWLATLRGRAGFAADRVLFYITGGGAFTNIKPSTGALPHGGGSEPGWTAGGGIEYAFTDNWTAKFEYLYAPQGQYLSDFPAKGCCLKTTASHFLPKVAGRREVDAAPEFSILACVPFENKLRT